MKAVEVTLAGSLYALGDARAAALALEGRAEVELRKRGTALVARLSPAAGEDPRALEGDFLNEALAQRCRRAVAGLLGPLSDAVDASLRAEGFPPPSEDPLEELEPTVREQRRADLEALGRRARELKPL